VSAASFTGLGLLITGVQAAELRATKDAAARAELLAVFQEVDPQLTLTSSMAFDVEGAGWDEARFNDGSGRYEKMLERLRALDPKKKRPLGQVRDILIAETAIKNGATLVTNDRNLRQVTSEFGGRAIDHLQFEREAAKIRTQQRRG
jgi:predicted nucleic acid-binding protein